VEKEIDMEMERHKQENKQIASCKLLITSDIHGHIFPTDYCGDGDLNLGLAKVTTRIKQERELHPELLLIDNGDLIQGTPLSTYALKHKSAIHPAILALNELGYDAAVFGNHEFNYGLDTLEGIVQDSEFPWLAANIVWDDEGKGKQAGTKDNEDIAMGIRVNEEITTKISLTGASFLGNPYIVKTLDSGVKVAILGITTHYIPNWERPEHIAGLQFKDAFTQTKAWVAHIRAKEKPDLLVVCYHGGFERDLSSGVETERLTGENQGYAMCTEIEGIDVLVTGHQHRYIANEVGVVTVIQPGCKGQALGEVNITFTKDEAGTWKITDKHAELKMIDENVRADEQIIALTKAVEDQTQVWLDQPIGQVSGDMTISSALSCRLKDHPFIEFVNKVQMEVAGVNVSNAALLNQDSNGFNANITLRDVLTNFMYPNTLTVLRLRGQDIKDALEQTANYFILNVEGQPEVNPSYIEPKPSHYNYDMWEGITYELDIRRPLGERVTLLQYQGQDLTMAQEIDVVMNSYRAGGGGDYDMYRNCPVVKEIMMDMSELIADYIVERGTIEASCDGNWRVVW
jgi:2',3'-cyclic-nucleotide 2'-phosphodiesterase/3'-nucleotidase